MHRISADMKEASIPVEIMCSVYVFCLKKFLHRRERSVNVGGEVLWQIQFKYSYIYTLTCNLYEKEKASIMIQACPPYMVCVEILYRKDRGFQCDTDQCRFYMLMTFTKNTSQDHEQLKRINDNRQKR